MTEQAPADHRRVDDRAVEYPRIVPVGDSAVLIEFGSGIDPVVNARVYMFAGRIEAAGNPAVVELVPTYRSLLVQYNPRENNYAEMSSFLNDLVSGVEDSPGSAAEPTVIELPVVYGGEDGPDIEAVAEYAGLSTEEVIEIHSGTGYRVYMIGFAPGFPYLGGLDERIACPRLKTPRTKVPAGSVGIAESQTGVYPNAGPGGWRLIGRTAVKLFDPHVTATNAYPSLISPGSEVRFVPVKSHANV
ncbi:MAG: 5-oxoprolinase subunit PxpB [Chloroflexi bacterium]|nr:5-oxoprolinase subunit PxpB [Chloroflexota bacterium]